MAELIIIGAGGHAVSCGDVALAAGWDALTFVDPRKAGTEIFGCPVRADLDDALAGRTDLDVAIAIGDNARRAAVSAEIAARRPDLRFPALVHPTAHVSPFARLDAGCVVMAGATIGPNSRVGRFAIVNTRASIDHDCVVEDHASLAPGVVTGGGVVVGPRSAVSIGAVVRHGVTIGRDTVVGAAAYVHRALPDAVLCWGVPAVVVRARAPDEPYL